MSQIAGLSAPRIQRYINTTTIQDVAGVNPVDSAPQDLPQARGQVTYRVQSVDNGFEHEFDVYGGVGEFSNSPERNFNPAGNIRNCTISAPTLNQVQSVTPASDSGGRIYLFTFSPGNGVPFTVEQTSANNLTDDLIVTQIAYRVVSGF